jgi:HlyD family secretion protein
MNKVLFVKKFFSFIKRHKILSGVIILALMGGGYGVYAAYFAPDAPLSYTLATVTRGALVSSVSGSGQVSSLQETNVTSTVSADILAVYVKPGDEVKAGTIMAYLDTKDAEKAVSNAVLALENSKLSYQKAVKQNTDQAANSLSSDTVKAYQGGYNAIANMLIDLPVIFDNTNDIFYNASHSPYFSDMQILTRADSTAITYKNQAGIVFDAAKAEYEKNFAALKGVSSNSSPDEIVSMLNTLDSILKKLLSALTGAHSTIDYIRDKMASNVPAEIATDKAIIASYVSKVNSHTTSIVNSLTAIDGAQDSSATAELSMKSAELSVKQAEDTLANARQTLYDHSIRAPYDGLVAKVPAKVGDRATNGTAIATVVTKDQVVFISLNEIDAAKVKGGDSAELTFDAIDDLALPGHIANVDLVGTVSQGVVTYQAEIAFDAIDPRVKSGMSVSASVTTASKENVLLVPSGAVKSQGALSAVQVVSGSYSKMEMTKGVTPIDAPVTKRVTVGDSNDTMVEIVEGLSEGDIVVTRTITASSDTTAPSIFSSLGGRATGTGAVRTMTR